MDFEILVNKNNLLEESYIPDNLIITDQNENNFHNYQDPTLKPMVNDYVNSYFMMMKEDMNKIGLDIIIDSGYRSYQYQQNIWDSRVKDIGLEETKKLVAPPGASEHQTGLAFDIGIIKNNQYTDDVTENDEEVKWLIENCHKYGFILRYPKGKEDITGYSFEPWHYRFVGIELATIINRFNLTLEEYYQKKDYYDEIANQTQKSQFKRQK